MNTMLTPSGLSHRMRTPSLFPCRNESQIPTTVENASGAVPKYCWKTGSEGPLVVTYSLATVTTSQVSLRRMSASRHGDLKAVRVGEWNSRKSSLEHPSLSRITALMDREVLYVVF